MHTTGCYGNKLLNPSQFVCLLCVCVCLSGTTVTDDELTFHANASTCMHTVMLNCWIPLFISEVFLLKITTPRKLLNVVLKVVCLEHTYKYTYNTSHSLLSYFPP